MLCWRDYWLKGEETGFMDEPMMWTWMQEDIPAKPRYADCPGRWAGGDGPEFPSDQCFDDGASLCFDGEPLKQPLEILGGARVTLDFSIDKPTVFVCVRLNDVKPDGSVARAAYGVLNLTRRDGHEKVKPLAPGKRYKVTVPISDTAYSFGKGHRVRVTVSTTYWPMIWPSPKPVELTLRTGTSMLELPVRPANGGPKLWRFHEPGEGPSMAATQIKILPSRNTVTRDVLTGRAEVLSERGGGIYRIEEHGMDFGSNTIERMAITEGNPLSCETEVTVASHINAATSRSTCMLAPTCAPWPTRLR